MHDDERYLFEALKAGARICPRHEADHYLVDAVWAVAAGDSFLTNAAQRALVRTGWTTTARPTRAASPPREQVIKLIAEAHTNREIGAILHLADKTVESHRANILRKAGNARSRRARAVRDQARAGGAVGVRCAAARRHDPAEASRWVAHTLGANQSGLGPETEPNSDWFSKRQATGHLLDALATNRRPTPADAGPARRGQMVRHQPESNVEPPTLAPMPARLRLALMVLRPWPSWPPRA
jgi:hypothetical protein